MVAATSSAPQTPSTTRTIHSFTTVFVQGTPTSVESASATGGGGSGLSVSDKIALGVGIGFGVPTLIIGIVQVRRMGYGASLFGYLH
jgi:hypothetical protein